MLWWDDGFSGRRGSKDYGSKYSLADGEEGKWGNFRILGCEPIKK